MLLETSFRIEKVKLILPNRMTIKYFVVLHTHTHVYTHAHTHNKIFESYIKLWLWKLDHSVPTGQYFISKKSKVHARYDQSNIK